MITFWLIAIALTGVAVAVIAIPLLQERVKGDVSRTAVNARIFRERLAELDTDLQENRIGKQEYQELRAELERTLLHDAPEPSRQTTKFQGGARIVLIAVALLPLLGLIYYLQQGLRPEAKEWISLNERLDSVVTTAIYRPEDLPQAALDDLVGFTRVLQARVLREGMEDPDSLYLLGICYLQLNQPQMAEPSLARAYDMDPQRTEFQLALAQASLLVNEGTLTAQTEDLLKTILRQYPDHQGALMLLGFGAFHSGDYAQAIEAWQPLLAARGPNSESGRLLQQSIQEAERLLAAGGSTPTAVADQSQAVASAAAEIAVTVDLDPSIKHSVSPDDTLFIFAKAASGPPMPLAVERVQARDFPVRVVLDDSKGMSPALKLSDHSPVVVTARVSKSGNAIAQAGDLESPPLTLELNDGRQTAELIIGANSNPAPRVVTEEPPGKPGKPTRLTVNIQASEELREKISAQDTLFVFAKAAAGPPMPLAVVKAQANQFPVEVILDDSKGMSPALKLSDFNQVVVTARISRSGNASAAPGDLQGISPTLSLNGGEQSLSLVINEVVQ